MKIPARTTFGTAISTRNLNSLLEYLPSRRSRGDETQISWDMTTHLAPPHVVSYTLKQAPNAYSLIEMLVYISVLAVLMGVGYAAVYRCMDNSTGLRRNAEDIASALRAGEMWRADVRAAGSNARIETNSNNRILHLPQPDKSVAYRFTESTLARQVGDGGWTPLLRNVKACEFLPEPRSVPAWRCELELQPRRKTLTFTRPLFTFLAVPSTASSQ